jgi:hypothetical protein
VILKVYVYVCMCVTEIARVEGSWMDGCRVPSRRVAAYSMTNNGSGHPNSYSYKQTNKQKPVKSSPVKSSPVQSDSSIRDSPSPRRRRRCPTPSIGLPFYVTLRLSCHRIESYRIESNRIESNRIESDRIESNRIESDRIGSDRIESNQLILHNIYIMNIEEEVKEEEKKTGRSYLFGPQIMFAVVPMKQFLFSFDLI